MINNYYYNIGVEESAIRKLFGYGIRRKAEIGEDNVFDFSLGNPNVPPPKAVTDTLYELLKMDPIDLHAYSVGVGHQEPREQIAQAYKMQFNHNASFEHVFLTCGAAFAIVISIGAVCNPGDEVIEIAPFFAEYSNWVKQNYCIEVQVMSRKEDFQIDCEAVDNAITEKTSAVIINSPNNPTGAIYTKKNLEDLAVVLNNAQKKFNRPIYLLVDEPYRFINYGNDVPFVPNIYENTIVINSATKFLSLAGERIGHVYVSSLMKDADKVFKAIEGAARAYGHVCAPVLFQRLYGKCFNIVPDTSLYEHNRELLCKILDECCLKYTKPSGAFYLFVKSPIKDSCKFSDFLKKYDILAVPSKSFGIEGWIRFSYCIPTKTITNSYDAFKNMYLDLKNNNL